MHVPLPAPALQHGEESEHLRPGLLRRHAGISLDHMGRAEVDHLIHGHLPHELPLLIAVGAVVGAGGAVGFGAQLGFVSQGHAAGLTEFHVCVFHGWNLLFVGCAHGITANLTRRVRFPMGSENNLTKLSHAPAQGRRFYDLHSRAEAQKIPVQPGILGEHRPHLQPPVVPSGDTVSVKLIVYPPGQAGRKAQHALHPEQSR